MGGDAGTDAAAAVAAATSALGTTDLSSLAGGATSALSGLGTALGDGIANAACTGAATVLKTCLATAEKAVDGVEQQKDLCYTGCSTLCKDDTTCKKAGAAATVPSLALFA